MHELMPVLFGAMLGVQFRRGSLPHAWFVCCVLLAATAASITSGEFAHSPLWILSDLTLVSLGAVSVHLPAAVRIAMRIARRRLRRRQHRTQGA